MLRLCLPAFTLLAILLVANAFSSVFRKSAAVSSGQRSLKMEYIPDGMTPAQWKALKAKEEEELQKKNFGAIGITKFKSRSFEAWQKSGQKNLFPVDPNAPLEEKPYMQRRGGAADGSDLKKQGLKGRGQGAPSKRLSVDDKYEDLEKQGKLRSSPFSLPWTNDAAQNYKPPLQVAQKSPQGAKTDSSSSKKASPPPNPTTSVPKKGFFGLF